MKIQCDVCSKEEASVFCTADEGALCDACDRRVHHANKLASKHQRFSLVHPTSKNSPLCDVCQEKRAFLFCQQDRAILCRDCDVSIHKANEHTQKHNRFLLTGVKLSAASALYISSSSSSSSSFVTDRGDLVPDSKSQKQPSTKKSVSLSLPSSHPPSIAKTSTPNSTVNKPLSSNTTVNKPLSSNTTVNKGVFSDATVNKEGYNPLINEGIGSTSSISEYLMETLPGWHVEDLLDFPSTPFGFCKPDDGILPFVGNDLGSNITPFSSETMGIRVPKAPTPLYPSQHYPQMGEQIGLKETKETTNMKGNNRRWADDAFTVPQISPPSSGSKRSIPFW
ncbi:hypothetical protein P3X46_002070 [Hevea brasiliensis]|uniref:B box-type domain-containing protein n=1 Tax=Hevea brasiliensis TaxID=3981 RepID=A0ABQ9N5N1_HEVBR|nr:B-box zinc finger protein 20 [Hevea brasiliensis]XP_057988221.1 B-box zinc finger protein 20 [Hevea brasiliensis]KAJ9186505.1 hypothetical protein P3X46_002070 [Hevea brasiliensis]